MCYVDSLRAAAGKYLVRKLPILSRPSVPLGGLRSREKGGFIHRVIADGVGLDGIEGA